jgi:uncharacterized protein YkwD
MARQLSTKFGAAPSRGGREPHRRPGIDRRYLVTWKASPGHNGNLLLAGIHRIGVARIDTPGVGYGEYWALALSQ